MAPPPQMRTCFMRRCQSAADEFPSGKDRSGPGASVASAVTCAVPVMNGAISPVRRRSQRYRAANTLPMTLSCSQTSPRPACRRRRGRRAWRWCRCRTASGRRPCRGRARSCGCSRRWRPTAEQLDVVDFADGPAAFDGLADAPGEIGQRFDVRRSMRSSWRSTRKNQLPPQATSPRTSPSPAPRRATCLCLR